jgi:hypothetical protein
MDDMTTKEIDALDAMREGLAKTLPEMLALFSLPKQDFERLGAQIADMRKTLREYDVQKN